MGIIPKIPDGLPKVLGKVQNPLAFLTMLVLLIAGLFAAVLFAPVADNLKFLLVVVFLGLLVWVLVVSVGYVTNSDRDRGFLLYHAVKNSGEMAENLLVKSSRETAGTPAGELTTGEEREKQKEALAEAISAVAEEAEKRPRLVDLALRALNEGKTDRAEILFELILEDENEGDKKRAEAAFHLGTLRFRHNTEGALEAFLKVTELTPGNIEGWNQAGHLFSRLGRYDEAIKAYARVMAIGKETGDRETVAGALVNLGTVFNDRGEMKSANEYYLKSLEMYEALGDEFGMAIAHCNLGSVYIKRGEMKMAEKMAKKSLAINRKQGSKEAMAVNLSNLGIIYTDRGEWKEAEKALMEALSINRELGRKEGKSRVFGGLGNLYLRKDDLDEAERMYKKALGVDEKLGHRMGIAKALRSLGNICMRKNDFDKAQKKFEEALAINRTLQNKEDMAIDYANLGRLFVMKVNPSAAREKWKEALHLYKEMGLDGDVKDIEAMLASLPPENDSDAD